MVLIGPILGLPLTNRGPTPSSPLPVQPSPVPTRRSYGIATAGLLITVLPIIPLVATVAWVLAPAGLVLVAIGLARSRRPRNARGRSTTRTVPTR